MNLYPVEISQTAASNSWSFNTQAIAGGICYQIYVKAATAGTTFDITLTDEKDNIVYNTAHSDPLTGATKTATGILNDFIMLPMRGKYTVACVDSSADEAYTGRLLIAD